MSVFVQILVGIASTVVSAALLYMCHAVYRAIHRLEETVRRVEALEFHARAARRRIRLLERSSA